MQLQIKTLNDQLAELGAQNNKMTDSDLKEFDKYQIMNDQAEKSAQ